MNNNKNVAPGMLLYMDRLEIYVDLLTDEQIGAVLKALFNYQADGEIPNFSNDKIASAAFRTLKQSVDDGIARYEKQLAASEYGAYCRREKSAGRQPMARDEYERTFGISVRDSTEDQTITRTASEEYRLKELKAKLDAAP